MAGPDLGSATAAILAGGLGTRLRPSVSDRPKVLARVRGRPYLAYLLDQLTGAGIRHVVLCTGYLGELVEEELGDAYGPARLEYSREEVRLGTGGALRLALERFLSDPVLVLNGDSYCDVDLAALWAAHRERAPAGTLSLVRVPDTARFGRVDLAEDGLLTAFQEKGEASGAGWINAGVYLLGKELLASIPTGRDVSLERDVLPAWIRKGLLGFPVEGRFLDIGTPQSYTRAERFFADGTSA